MPWAIHRTPTQITPFSSRAAINVSPINETCRTSNAASVMTKPPRNHPKTDISTNFKIQRIPTTDIGLIIPRFPSKYNRKINQRTIHHRLRQWPKGVAGLQPLSMPNPKRERDFVPIFRCPTQNPDRSVRKYAPEPPSTGRPRRNPKTLSKNLFTPTLRAPRVSRLVNRFLALDRFFPGSFPGARMRARYIRIRKKYARVTGRKAGRSRMSDLY